MVKLNVCIKNGDDHDRKMLREVAVKTFATREDAESEELYFISHFGGMDRLDDLETEVVAP